MSENHSFSKNSSYESVKCNQVVQKNCLSSQKFQKHRVSKLVDFDSSSFFKSQGFKFRQTNAVLLFFARSCKFIVAVFFYFKDMTWRIFVKFSSETLAWRSRTWLERTFLLIPLQQVFKSCSCCLQIGFGRLNKAN